MLDQTKFMPTRTKSNIEKGSPRASKTLSTDVGTCTPERLTARAKTSASNGALVMVRLNILPQLKPPAPTAKSAEPPESLLPLPTLPTVSTSMSSFFVGPASSNAFPSIVATTGASAAAELAGASIPGSPMWMGTRKEVFWTERGSTGPSKTSASSIFAGSLSSTAPSKTVVPGASAAAELAGASSSWASLGSSRTTSPASHTFTGPPDFPAVPAAESEGA
mmetsp:Transcript_47896/g.137446  ORF Transcript_47896/g.137446 Transcript_47896/m.137446 type:complete len:221 (-) Transcript_47896:554-1216(-)